MAEPWCDVMDMAQAGCAHCRPAAERARLARIERELARPGGHAPYDREVSRRDDFELGPVVVAKFQGDCPVCKDTIEPGDHIRTARPGWIHVECAP